MSVQSYKNTTFLTHKQWRSDRPTEGKCRSLPLSKDETRTRAATKTGEGDSAPHKHAVAARPSTRLAGAAHAVFERTRRARPCSYPKGEQYPQQAATKKETLDAKEARKDQPRTRSSTASSTASHHREPRQREPRHQSEKQTPCTHRNTHGPPLKSMSVERRKARPAVQGPLEDADAASYKAPTQHSKPPHESANPRRRRTTSVPHTTTESATARTASPPSRGKRPPEPSPVPRAKRATAHATRFAPLAHARRRRVTCLELADRFPTAKRPRGGRTEPFRTSRRAPRCAARGPSRTT